jgi:hypothetical protein
MNSRFVSLTGMLVVGFLSAGCLQRAAWLSDGRRIAFVRAGGVWIADPEGRQTRAASLPGADDAEIAAGPGGLIAVTARAGRGPSRLLVIEAGGAVRFSATVPGDTAQLPAGCWSPNGRFLALQTAKDAFWIADLEAGEGRLLEGAGETARFTAAGDLIILGGGPGGWSLEVRDGTGKSLGSRAWRAPQGQDEAVPHMLTDDGQAVWWRARKKEHESMILAGPDGRALFSSDRAMAGAGPDSRSYVTEEGGYAVIRAGSSPVNLNALYNRLLRMDLSWHLADPNGMADAYDPTALLKSCTPAFSPDGTRVAILTPRLLAVGILATGEVTALAKW